VPDGLAAARRRYEESLDLWQRTGDPWGISRALSRLGFVANEEGGRAAARRLQEESLAICRRIGDLQGVGWTLKNLGQVAAAEGVPAAAYAHYVRSLEAWLDIGYRSGVADILGRLSAQAARCGHPEAALRWAGAAAATHETLRGGRPPPAPPAGQPSEGDLAAARRALGAAAADAAWRAGRSLAPAQVLAEALEGLPAASDGRGAAPGAAPLTRRERDAAVLVAAGLTNRQIAERLVVAERTAGNHVDHILAKLGFHSRAQIAAWTVTRGLSAGE
jgi:non-specific serine/threonine protein kinase